MRLYPRSDSLIHTITNVYDWLALGVILFEIGTWERVQDIDRHALAEPEVANRPESVRQRLLKHANRRLEFYMGRRYADLVVFCLSAEQTDSYEKEQKRLEKMSEEIEYLEQLSNAL